MISFVFQPLTCLLCARLRAQERQLGLSCQRPEARERGCGCSLLQSYILGVKLSFHFE